METLANEIILEKGNKGGMKIKKKEITDPNL